MGHRTLSLALVFRALFLDSEAFDELRDDDDPIIEALFLLVLIGLIAAALALVGQVLASGSVPSIDSIRQTVLTALQQQPWWPAIGSNPVFLRMWDAGWAVFPALFGAPDPARSALNLLLWPIWLVLSWLVYGVLAHVFAHGLGGRGSLRGSLGAVSLSFTPFLFHGLGIVPFLVLGGALNTWQLLLRYKAVRSAHALSWGRSAVATLLPYFVYLLVWLLLGSMFSLVVAALVRR